ncbi:MAG: hypothetical protein HC854_17365 [Flavobacterium sp.]|nr:hypothetical protein [Flavobacterium sp.]
MDIKATVGKIIFDEDIDFKTKFKLQEAKIDLYKDAEVDVTGGFIEYLKIRMVGAPILRAEKLRIVELSITMENSSKAELFCEKKIEVYLENKSKLELYGQPSVTVKAIKGSSLLQKRE